MRQDNPARWIDPGTRTIGSPVGDGISKSFANRGEKIVTHSRLNQGARDSAHG